MAELDDLLRDGPDALVELYRQAEDDILIDMARRIKEYDFFIPAARFQKAKLEAMGLVWQEILRRLSALTGRTQEELTALWKQAAALAAQENLAVYRAGGVYDAGKLDRKALNDVLRGGLRQTAGLFRNLTQSTARAGSSQFADALDRAWLQISSGAFDRQSAVRMAVHDLAEKGVCAARYRSGHADYLEVAVRRAIVTGLNQSTLRMQEALADQMGCDLVEVSAHSGARPSHAEWQGRIYSRSGKDKRYPDFVESTGYGTGAGLGGWNCRHRWYPYVEGTPRRMTDAQLEALDKPAYRYRGQDMTAYQAEQKQRYFERQIRRWKREYLAARELGEDIGTVQRLTGDFVNGSMDTVTKINMIIIAVTALAVAIALVVYMLVALKESSEAAGQMMDGFNAKAKNVTSNVNAAKSQGKQNGFARGTASAPRGRFLVGENGPEEIELRGGERIYSATQSRARRAIATGGSSGGVVNNYFNLDVSKVRSMAQVVELAESAQQYNRKYGR